MSFDHYTSLKPFSLDSDVELASITELETANFSSGTEEFVREIQRGSDAEVSGVEAEDNVNQRILPNLLGLSNKTCSAYGPESDVPGCSRNVAVSFLGAMHKNWRGTALFARERAVYQSRKEASVVEVILVEHVRGFAPSQWTSIVYANSALKAVPMITITP